MANDTGNLAPSEATLSRDLGLFDITMVGVGAMIGAGIFVLTGTAASVAGPALGVAFLLNGLVTLLFSAFGLLAMKGNPDWQSNFSQDFLPRGMGGIFVAMGVTFIAFEGVEGGIRPRFHAPIAASPPARS